MSTARRLHLATLKDQETDQPRRPLIPSHLQQTPEWDRARANGLPRSHSHVAQRKYNLDDSSPAWKKFVHRWAFIPIFKFFYNYLGFNTPNGIDEQGRPFCVEHQGCFVDEAEAVQDAARYPFGYVVPNLPLGRSLPSETQEGGMYYPRGQVDLEPLAQELAKEVRAVRAAVQAVRAI